MQLTEEQRDAIEKQGQVIVSASAGSGKTFVMIERLVSLILAGEDVSKVLAVTFTNKAAAQMRDRLRTAILKKIGESADGEREKLKEQLNQLPLADISTIHSFCARLVRTHFFAAGVDPAFRILSEDDAEGKAIAAQAMDAAFEEAYEAGTAEFSSLLSVYFRKKKDTRLRVLVRGLYSEVSGLEDPVAALNEIVSQDRFGEACEFLYRDFKNRAAFLSEIAEDAGAYFAEHSLRAFSVCADIVNAAKNLTDACGLFDMRERAQVTPAISVMPSMTKAVGEELLLLKKLSGASKEIKKLYVRVRETEDEETERKRAKDADGRAAALAALTLSFAEHYGALKREANVLDYDDLEHAALRLLQREDVRSAIREKYKYVFVDEYQDVNPVQEKILSRVWGENVFLVGDAKQAIYGFRGSSSAYFKEKEKTFGHALRLTSNFRSADAILELANRVFGSVIEDYPPMRGSDRYEGHGGGVFFRKIGREKTAREELDVYSVLSAARGKEEDALAREVLGIIRDELGKEWFDADDGKVKKVGYGDIAVLVRKNSGDAERIVRLLSEHSVPVTSSSKINVCECFEARLLIDWLSYLDNDRQDVPLAGALLSAIGGFSDGELARIRLASPRAFTFRDACERYVRTKHDGLSHKLVSFYEKADRYRALSHVRTASEMANLLLADGLEAQIFSKGDGERRLSRVRRLLSEGEDRSTHGFLRRLREAEYYVDDSEGGGEDAVKVLTMHAAKGLEFPVVVLASLDTPFHAAERDEILWTQRFLLALKSYDAENKLVYNTVVRRAAALSAEEKEIAEETNLLYVALTRAKVREYLLFEGKESALSPKYAGRFSDFFDFSALADYWSEGGGADAPVPKTSFVYRGEGEETEKILAAYCVPYAHRDSVRLPAKSSATALLKGAEKAVRGRGDMPAATTEEGLAYHAFLQHVRFGKPAGEELARMAREGIIEEERLALLRPEKLEEILNIPCLKDLAGRKLYREQTFLLSLPACEIPPNESVAAPSEGDEIVFQGAIDLLYEDGNGYVLVDYKYSSRSDGELSAAYAPQIALYKKAVARILRVREETVRARIVNIMQCREIPV